jgi:Mn2+/Fe2+ NRAMP family transporter
MKKILSVALGVVTSVGGFLDVGSIATSAQAGAAFGYSLLWPILLGTVCIVFLVEMSGRFSAVSGHTVTDAVRKRFGAGAFLVPFAAGTLVHLLVLASEIGGVCVALELVTGISFQLWAVPVALVVWLLLWLGTFDVIENGVALLGLVTLSFVAGAIMLHPDWSGAGRGLLPSLPSDERAHYLFLVVSILGATVAPYLFLFYSSGAIEDKWDRSYLRANRAIAVIGMGFGSLISMAVLVVAAVVLQPKGIRVEDYGDAADMLVPAFGRWGFWLFAASLGIACFGAALELALVIGYTFAQGFGWAWGENKKPKDAARFSAVYTIFIALSALIVMAGVDPLKLTVFSMALTAVILPLAVVPFLVLMNDPRYMGRHRNGAWSNAVVVFVIFLSCLLAIVAIPLEIVGSK